MDLKDLIYSDLVANTGKSGFVHFAKSFFLEPAVKATTLYRLAAHFHSNRKFKLSKIVWRWNVSASGCYLSPASTIGPGLALPHPTAVVIGEGAVLGSNVTIYQSVTIGRGVSSGSYPTIDDCVTVYPNAVVIGAIRLAKRTTIGAHALVMHDTTEGATLLGQRATSLSKP